MIKSALASALAALSITTTARAQNRSAQVDSIFSFATAETPGCGVGVSQKGKVVLDHAYGLADVEHHTPLNERSLFDIGSTQKQFVAAAVLLLVQDGRLSLTDDIRKYLPEMPDLGHKVTIDNLLTHTSGIRDWPGLQPLAEEGIDVLELIMRQRGLNFIPGEQWSYSTSGFVLLKEIVARRTGTSFAEFAQKRLFAPLGMTSSAYVEDIMQSAGERAIGYQKQGAAWKQFMRLGNERGGGAIVSTTGDLLTWNDALTTGKLGKFVTQKLQETAVLKNGRRISYARGLNVNDIPEGKAVSHSGGAAGYSTWMGRIVDKGLSVVVVCNFDPVSATNLAGKVVDAYLAFDDSQVKDRGPVAAKGVDVSSRAGTYIDHRSGDMLRLTANNGRLAITGGVALVPVSADRFRPQHSSLFFRSDDDFEITFRSNDEFEIKSMEGEIASYRRATPWSPSATELQAFDGRYESTDLGTVFEMVPDGKGLAMRFERAPAMLVQLLPIEQDVFAQSLRVIRFGRDAGGRIVGFEQTSPVVNKLPFTRVGNRSSSSPAVAAAPVKDSSSAAQALPAPKLEGLVGEYELAPGRNVAITLEDSQLFGQPSGSGKQSLVHISASTFAVGKADGPIRMVFTIGADGRATALVMQQSGRERTLPRVK